jgi:hypothetical protein
MINYEFAILIAVLAFVYSNLLMQPDAMLNGFYNRMDVRFKTDERKQNGKGRHWLFMITVHCEKCIAGQLAFWLFPFFNYIGYILNPVYTSLVHLLFVAFAIFSAAIIHGIYNKYIKP